MARPSDCRQRIRLLALNRRAYERDAEAMRRLTEKAVRLTERTVRLTVVNTVVATLALIAAVISPWR